MELRGEFRGEVSQGSWGREASNEGSCGVPGVSGPREVPTSSASFLVGPSRAVLLPEGQDLHMQEAKPSPDGSSLQSEACNAARPARTACAARVVVAAACC